MSRTATPTKISTPVKWKVKLRSLYKLRSLSASPSTPERTPTTPDADFLTPLDVYDDVYFTPLTDQKDITLGDLTLPPPPPPQRAKWASMDPDSPLFEHSLGPRSPGPRVKPYFATANRQPNTTEIDTCFICEELLETTLYLEKLVPLLCGDRVHEECLRTAVNHELEKKLQNRQLCKASSIAEMMNAVFPHCNGPLCSAKHESPMAVPSNNAFLDDLNDDLRLSMKLTRFDEPRTLDPAKINNQAAGRPSFSESLPELLPQSKPVPKVPLKIETKPPSRPSSLFSNTSVKTAATASVRVSVHGSIPPEELKLAFIQHMINHAPGFDLSMLVSLGSLRLADQLLVSTDKNGAFELKNVYLFTNYLVVWSANEPPQFVMVPLSQETIINTPIPSVLQVSVSGPGVSFNVRLHSETSSIIEKWGIAISDTLMIFPPNIFSSTIRLPDIAKPIEMPVPQKPKTRVSPIMESCSEFTPEIPERSPERGTLNYGGLQVYSDEISPLSRPTSPLRLQKNSPSSDESTKVGSEIEINKHHNASLDKLAEMMKIIDLEPESDSDSDEDLDCELINKVMNSL